MTDQKQTGEPKPVAVKPAESKPGDGEKDRDSGQSTETQTPKWASGGGGSSGEREKRQQDAAARGAGSGANAVRQRSKLNRDDGGEVEVPEGLLPQGKTLDDYKAENYNPESEYPAGDPTKGKPDFQRLAEGGDYPPIAMRDHREYLKSQALKNERANDEAQARFVEGFKEKRKVLGVTMDPDFMRDKSMQQLELETDAEAGMHTEQYVEDYKKRRAEETRRIEERRQAVETATT